jgi:hypothetical protein
MKYCVQMAHQVRICLSYMPVKIGCRPLCFSPPDHICCSAGWGLQSVRMGCSGSLRWWLHDGGRINTMRLLVLCLGVANTVATETLKMVGHNNK